MKRKLIIYISVTLLSLGGVTAQNTMDSVLNAIERNNTTLKVLREERDAMKLQNKTGIALSDPEVEFSYLWGSPEGVSERTDFSVSQSFDIPTILGMKRRVAEGENGLLDLRYKQERMFLLLEAKQVLIESVYTNLMYRELSERFVQARRLADAYNQKLENGEANILEVNKVNLSLSLAKGELERMGLEQNRLQKELQRLNGGTVVEFGDTTYSNVLPYTDFEDWYMQAESKNPVLQYVQQEIKVGKNQVRLSKSMNLPSLSAGYSSELTRGQNYRGVSVGMSIPLWSNKNRVKQSRAALEATESKMQDTKLQFYTSLNILYDKALGLQKVAQGYKEALMQLNNTSLLNKALDAGQISLLEYIMELGLYYDGINQALSAERDYQLTLAELQTVEL